MSLTNVTYAHYGIKCPVPIHDLVNMFYGVTVKMSEIIMLSIDVNSALQHHISCNFSPFSTHTIIPQQNV